MDFTINYACLAKGDHLTCIDTKFKILWDCFCFFNLTQPAFNAVITNTESKTVF